MNKKLFALVLIGSMILMVLPMAIVPSKAVIPEPEFAIQINGQFTGPAQPLVLKGIQYCNTFEVDVIAWQVVDLYAYEFKLNWPAGYFSLVSHEVVHIHTNDYVLKEKVDPNGLYYQQAVTAISPATGVTGTFVVAKLIFHIDTDACWPNQVDLAFYFTIAKMSDSSTNDMNPSDQGGNLKLLPLQPDLKFDPPITVESVLGTTFTVQIEISDVVKMKSFHFVIWWDDHQITTDAQNVFIKDFLPPPYETANILLLDSNQNGVNDGVQVDVIIPCEKSPRNGTGGLMGIRFTTRDPWGTTELVDDPASYPILISANQLDPDYLERPAVPPYNFYIDPSLDHGIWYPSICENFIYISGYIDVVCPTPKNQVLYDMVNGVKVWSWQRDILAKKGLPKVWTDPPAYYQFRAVPGDFSLDGHADIEDLAAIAKVYGKSYLLPRDGWPFYCNYPPGPADLTEWYYSAADGMYHYFPDFDLNGDGVVDVFDVVIVAKNFCRTTPDPLLPVPLPDP
jgi:hypothetical protein